MKKSLLILPVLATLAASTLSSHAALTTVGLTGFASSTQINGTFNIGLTLNDAFAYDPTNFGSANPNQGGPSGFPGSHGDISGAHFLQYTLTNGQFTAGSGFTTDFVVDLWGRTTNLDRDNNFTITLYNGSFTGTAVATSATISITDASPYRLRTSFDLADGAIFDRFEIRAANTSYFSIAETRAAGEVIPEPSAALLGGLGVLALLRRRRA